ncbi:MAG: hypothetical protein JW863_17040 [Chitinispirillaceae bacterium]|nr:hypothetical protein [Chitinispirillaceae bacterium]
MKSIFTTILFFSASALFLTVSCDLFDWDALLEQDPTKSRMEGVWEVTEAYNEDGESILDSISIPITLFHLSSDNTVISTAGPMVTYLVYGGSKYTSIASKIDEVFNYASLDLNGGEWFIDGGQVTRFTLEMKLEGLPGQKSLTDLLGWLGIGGDYLDVTIYHKFMDVKVTFEDWNDTVMTWEFDNTTEAVYNKKNSRGEYVLWEGWPADNFSHCSFVLTKRVKDIKDLIKEATE